MLLHLNVLKNKGTKKKFKKYIVAAEAIFQSRFITLQINFENKSYF